MHSNTTIIGRATRGLTTLGAIALAAATAGCFGAAGSGGDPGEMTGTAEIALAGVPSDGTCIQVVAAGNRTTAQNFNAAAGSTSMVQMKALPLGQVSFTASAFSGTCPPAGGAVPNWVSDAAFITTIAVSPPALVTLNLVRNGSAIVSVGFNDGPDGGTAGSDGGAPPVDGGSSGGGASGFRELMQVNGVVGEVTAQGFTSAFFLDNFTIDAKTPSTLGSGSGAGTGKTTWTASATFQAQAGFTDLANDAAKGKVLSPVVVGRFSSGLSLIYKVTLTNALISSITADSHSGAAGKIEETVTFSFGTVIVELEGQPNPDGTIGAATVATFDLVKNTGPSPGTLTPLQFIFGGPAVPPAEAVSAFVAPSETNTTSASSGSGAGTGKTTFGDASVTLPFDTTALTMLIAQVAGAVDPSASVQFPAAGTPGGATVGTYGFSNVQFHETTVSDDNATIAFGAPSFSWTFGGQTATFP
jgi:type VI protein secretion system component Hcp